MCRSLRAQEFRRHDFRRFRHATLVHVIQHHPLLGLIGTLHQLLALRPWLLGSRRDRRQFRMEPLRFGQERRDLGEQSQGLRQRPSRPVVFGQPDEGRQQRRFGQPEKAGTRGHTPSVIDDVDRCEWDVVRIAAQLGDHGRTGLVDAFGRHRLEAKLAKGGQPPVADDFLRRLHAGAIHAVDALTVSEHRAERERYMGLLLRHRSRKEHLEIRGQAIAVSEHALDHRTDRVP
jgi:hypothetical protein